MKTGTSAPTKTESTPAYVLPQFDVSRRRRVFDGRVRSIRRTFIAGGLIGTVAFTALAGYESHVASGATNTPSTTAASQTQGDGTNFFSGQSSSSLDGSGSTSSSSTSTQTHTRTQSS